MGIRLFSVSSSNFEGDWKKCAWRKVNRLFSNKKSSWTPNPNPENYTILAHKEFSNGKLLVKIQYDDCTNYEGKKILLYDKCTLKQLQDQKLIDPHFSDNKEFKSPIARFEPTIQGWMMGCMCAEFD